MQYDQGVLRWPSSYSLTQQGPRHRRKQNKKVEHRETEHSNEREKLHGPNVVVSTHLAEKTPLHRIADQSPLYSGWPYGKEVSKWRAAGRHWSKGHKTARIWQENGIPVLFSYHVRFLVLLG